MKVASPRWTAIAALALLPACQQMPMSGLPYSVTDDCTVQRSAAAPSPASGFSFGVGAPISGGSRDAPRRSTASGDSGGTSDGPREERRDSRPRGGFGFGFGLPLGGPMPEPDIADQLAQSGPQFPAQFSMSCAPVQGFVRGGWPVVIDYQPSGVGEVVLEIHTVGSDQPHVVPLDSGARRQIVTLDLPQSLGATPQLGLFLVRSVKKDGKNAGGLQLFGLGAGPRAVGSVAIDQVDFQPGTMRVSQKQKASYSFYSRSDFNRGVVEILRVQRGVDEIKVTLARSTPLPVGINRGTWVGKKEQLTWDGLDGNNHISSGPHLLQVRAWLNAQDDRDWVAAWSLSTVVVSK